MAAISLPLGHAADRLLRHAFGPATPPLLLSWSGWPRDAFGRLSWHLASEEAGKTGGAGRCVLRTLARLRGDPESFVLSCVRTALCSLVCCCCCCCWGRRSPSSAATAPESKSALAGDKRSITGPRPAKAADASILHGGGKATPVPLQQEPYDRAPSGLPAAGFGRYDATLSLRGGSTTRLVVSRRSSAPTPGRSESQVSAAGAVSYAARTAAGGSRLGAAVPAMPSRLALALTDAAEGESSRGAGGSSRAPQQLQSRSLSLLLGRGSADGSLNPMFSVEASRRRQLIRIVGSGGRSTEGMESVDERKESRALGVASAADGSRRPYSFVAGSSRGVGSAGGASMSSRRSAPRTHSSRLTTVTSAGSLGALSSANAAGAEAPASSNGGGASPLRREGIAEAAPAAWPPPRSAASLTTSGATGSPLGKPARGPSRLTDHGGSSNSASRHARGPIPPSSSLRGFSGRESSMRHNASLESLHQQPSVAPAPKREFRLLAPLAAQSSDASLVSRLNTISGAAAVVAAAPRAPPSAAGSAILLRPSSTLGHPSDSRSGRASLLPPPPLSPSSPSDQQDRRASSGMVSQRPSALVRMSDSGAMSSSPLSAYPLGDTAAASVMGGRVRRVRLAMRRRPSEPAGTTGAEERIERAYLDNMADFRFQKILRWVRNAHFCTRASVRRQCQDHDCPGLQLSWIHVENARVRLPSRALLPFFAALSRAAFFRRPRCLLVGTLLVRCLCLATRPLACCSVGSACPLAAASRHGSRDAP